MEVNKFRDIKDSDEDILKEKLFYFLPNHQIIFSSFFFSSFNDIFLLSFT